MWICVYTCVCGYLWTYTCICVYVTRVWVPEESTKDSPEVEIQEAVSHLMRMLGIKLVPSEATASSLNWRTNFSPTSGQHLINKTCVVKPPLKTQISGSRNLWRDSWTSGDA